MDTTQWNLIEHIIDQALELDSKEQEKFVQKKTKDDEELYEQIMELLHSIEESGKSGFLEPDTIGKKAIIEQFFEDMSSASTRKLIGTSIGLFTLTHLLGKGGMATVYKGERQDGSIRQEVAIKILYNNIHSEESIIRFRMEQEILANLKHPNIAHFIDAGITEEGNPYFIMECVDGLPISEYSTQNDLTYHDILQIFKQLCKAVSYAHRNMVVHRDLKPNNIFVTAEGQVKVLDFSIAKLLDPSFLDRDLVKTRTGLRLLSPSYCAPEQFQSEPVTTATDVYTMGLVLFEILTGKQAIENKDKSLKEIEKIICYSDLRRTLSLPTHIDQDLKAIIFKAIRAEPEYRYESAAQLLEDIQNFEKNLPVTAQNDTIKYRIGKFTRRHLKGIATATGVIILLLSLGIFYTHQIKKERDKATLEASRAQATADFLISIFSKADIADNYKNLTAEDILDKGSKVALNRFDQNPLTKEYILRKIGNIYSNLQLFEKSEPLLAKSLQLCEDNTDSNDLLRAQCYHDFGANQIDLNNFNKAHKYLTRSQDILAKLSTSIENKNRIAINNSELGWLEYEMGNYKMADSLIQLALNFHLEYQYQDRPFQLANNQLYLGWVKNSLGNYHTADSLFSESLAGFRSLGPNFEHKIALGLSGKGRNLFDQGFYSKAEPIIEEAIPISKKIYGDDNSEYASVLKIMGLIKMRLKKYDESELYLIHALRTYKNSNGEENSDYIIALGELGALSFYKKDYTKAAEIFKKVVEKNKILLGTTHPEIATGLNNLATILEQSGQIKESIPYYKEAVMVAEKNFKPTHPKLIYMRHNTAKAYAELKEFKLAESIYLKNYKAFKNDEEGVQDNFRKMILKDLMELYEKWDLPDEAAKYREQLSGISE